MDSVRFGRVLGIGTRLAAKTVVQAMDAATAPNPSAVKPAAAARPAAVTKLSEKAAQTATQVRQTSEGVKRGGKRFGEAVWGPFVKLSGVLWLEFTGVFFGLFAFSAGVAVWRQRGDLRATATNHDAHQHVLWAVLMMAVFGYFCFSSFLRARRREKRKA